MSDTDDTTTDQARDFVRQLFSRSNKVEITDQGLSADDLNTLFDNGND